MADRGKANGKSRKGGEPDGNGGEDSENTRCFPRARVISKRVWTRRVVCILTVGCDPLGPAVGRAAAVAAEPEVYEENND